MEMATAAVGLARLIAAPPAGEALGAAAGGANSDGDAQKKLDVMADELFSGALKTAGIGAYLSEEVDDVGLFDPAGEIAVAIDPLDGSSNIDVNAPIGTVFSILPMPAGARDEPALAFRQSGRAQLAAGFFVYGPQTSLVLTLGRGVQVFTLDREAGDFRLTRDQVSIPAKSFEYAINASNARQWHDPVKRYIDACLEGEGDGEDGRAYNMRWVGSLVADAYRIFTRGGVFLYPGDRRKGYENGRLRLMYEANPVAFLAEQAGGAAIDGITPILDLTPHAPHQRAPLIMGSAENVARVRQNYLDHLPPMREAGALGRVAPA
jgi:fructose-1,6-bisphosphatase I